MYDQADYDSFPDPEDPSACRTCSIPGAPAHEPSNRCQYRPHYRAHCTCRACWGA